MDTGLKSLLSKCGVIAAVTVSLTEKAILSVEQFA